MSILLLCIVCLAVGGSSAEVTEPSGGLDMAVINLKSQPGSAARINLGQGSNAYTVGADDVGFFIQKGDEVVVAIDSQGATVEALTTQTMTAASLTLNGVPQFAMISLELFDSEPVPASKSSVGNAVSSTLPSPDRWSSTKTLLCGGLSLLIAERPGDSLNRTYQVGVGTQVRIQATAHFIDDWQGETAFLTVNDHYVWTFAHDQRNSIGKLSTCGSAVYPESRFSVPIDVTITSTSETIVIALGSNLDEASEAYLGLSSISIYVRPKLATAVLPAII